MLKDPINITSNYVVFDKNKKKHEVLLYHFKAPYPNIVSGGIVMENNIIIDYHWNAFGESKGDEFSNLLLIRIAKEKPFKKVFYDYKIKKVNYDNFITQNSRTEDKFKEARNQLLHTFCSFFLNVSIEGFSKLVEEEFLIIHASNSMEDEELYYNFKFEIKLYNIKDETFSSAKDHINSL